MGCGGRRDRSDRTASAGQPTGSPGRNQETATPHRQCSLCCKARWLSVYHQADLRQVVCPGEMLHQVAVHLGDSLSRAGPAEIASTRVSVAARTSAGASRPGRARANTSMSSFTRVAVTSGLSTTFLTVALRVGGAPAATTGKSPQAIGPCGPTLPPHAYCPPDKVAM